MNDFDSLIRSQFPTFRRERDAGIENLSQGGGFHVGDYLGHRPARRLRRPVNSNDLAVLLDHEFRR